MLQASVEEASSEGEVLDCYSPERKAQVVTAREVEAEHCKKATRSSNDGTAVLEEKEQAEASSQHRQEVGTGFAAEKAGEKAFGAFWMELCCNLVGSGSRLTLAPAESMHRPYPKQHWSCSNQAATGGVYCRYH